MDKALCLAVGTLMDRGLRMGGAQWERWREHKTVRGRNKEKEHPAPYDEERYTMVDGLSKAIHRTRALSW
ncbi:hypothetical protein SRHO_G00200070 [Serrasalmus rhombeus]